jgi:hypothetical protein
MTPGLFAASSILSLSKFLVDSWPDQVPNRAVIDDPMQPANRNDLLVRLEHGFGVANRGDAPAVKSAQ